MIMPKNRTDTMRVSREAKRTLQVLADDMGLTKARALDAVLRRMAGASKRDQKERIEHILPHAETREFIEHLRARASELEADLAADAVAFRQVRKRAVEIEETEPAG